MFLDVVPEANAHLFGCRTVKTDEDTIQRDTEERTITISGAADEND